MFKFATRLSIVLLLLLLPAVALGNTNYTQQGEDGTTTDRPATKTK